MPVTTHHDVLCYYTSLSVILSQDKNGTEDDIITALILNPNCEESLSLIARVFPGKSKDDLISSVKANSVRTNLESEMRRISSCCQRQSKNADDIMPPQASKHLATLGLTFSDDGEGDEMAPREVLSDGSKSDVIEEDRTTHIHISSPENMATGSAMQDSGGVFSVVIIHIVSDGCL